jgi:hypothetical protein
MMIYLADSKVDAQIESLHSLQARVDREPARTGACAETARLLPPWPTPAWASLIQPNLERADSM